MNDNLENMIEEMARSARLAALDIMNLDSKIKDNFLNELADLIESNIENILSANKLDINKAYESGLSKPLIERLTFDKRKVLSMANGVREVSKLQDPVGEIIEEMSPPRKFDLKKIRVPIGVIGIIYESRPNVTIDCAILCLKSGNACILRGGKESFNTNKILIDIIKDCLNKNAININAIQFIPTTDREALNALLKQDKYIHCIIPRGGEGLIRFTVENSSIPVIKHYTGVCSVYIDEFYDYELAKKITLNSKCQRPSVCNAAENLIIHQNASDILPKIANELAKNNVEIRVDSSAKSLLMGTNIPIKDSNEDELSIEYNDLVISIAVVPDLKSAINLINEHGSGHTDVIVTTNQGNAKKFLYGVDSSTVLHNATTRFSDGFEFGLGAEIGISTDRLHARGPMGLNELCTYKYIVNGKGEIKD